MAKKKTRPGPFTWNYRLMRKVEKLSNGYLSESLGVYGVHYNKKNKVTSWDTEPVYILGSNKIDLEQDLKWIKLAFKKKILNYKNGKVWKTNQ